MSATIIEEEPLTIAGCFHNELLMCGLTPAPYN